MHAENTADLPVAYDVIGKPVARAERFTFANWDVVNEAAREDIWQIKSRNTAIQVRVVRRLNLATLRAKTARTSVIHGLRTRVGNDVSQAVRFALL